MFSSVNAVHMEEWSFFNISGAKERGLTPLCLLGNVDLMFKSVLSACFFQKVPLKVSVQGLLQDNQTPVSLPASFKILECLSMSSILFSQNMACQQP